MATQRLVLPPGVNDLEETIARVRLQAVDLEHGLAKLLLTVGTPPTASTAARPAATKLAIWVDRSAVTSLSEALNMLLATTPEWRLPTGSGIPT